MNWYSINQPHSALPALQINKKLRDPSLYIPSTELSAAVDVALALGQPLLLTGEPGTGKSELADHLAWYFNLDKPAVVSVQTTSVAKDLYYKYDALGHFQYNQHHREELSEDELVFRFIRFQGLGLAFKQKDKRMVVLIDEIDKAPRDLPNDILTALDRLTVEVPEIKKSYQIEPEQAPIIIITSNSEKNLPDPFLRRVVYYHINFPSPSHLLDILSKKMPGLQDIQLLINHFERLRTDESRLRKKPATSELLLWADLLAKMGFDLKGLKDVSNLEDTQKDLLKKSYSVLAKTQEDLRTLYQLLDKK
jgi:MoxR-like ATPase